MKTSSARLFWLLVCGLAISALGWAQNTPAGSTSSSSSQSSQAESGSLADAARTGKAQKTARAKKVFTDEDMETMAGPLPRLKMTGPENADEIIAAIGKYREGHTPEQIENAVRTWYERYDEMMGAAIQGNIDVRSLRSANTMNGYDLCSEGIDYYQECRYRQMAEARGARADQAEMMSNSELTVRIQHAFMKVRGGLMQYNLRYPWFKIRTTNNIDTY